MDAFALTIFYHPLCIVNSYFFYKTQLSIPSSEILPAVSLFREELMAPILVFLKHYLT